MQIIFYNNFHNGDIFYSREFIKDIMIKTGEQHQYNHNNSFSILKDISIEQVKGNSLPNFNLYHKSQNKIFINSSEKSYQMIQFFFLFLHSTRDHCLTLLKR